MLEAMMGTLVERGQLKSCLVVILVEGWAL